MSITAKLTIDNSQFKQGMKDAENTANKTMSNVSANANNSAKTLNNIANAANNATNAMRGGFSGVVGLLGKMGPYGAVAAAGIGLIGTAIFGVIKGIGALSDKLNGIAKSAKAVDMTASAYIGLERACRITGVEMTKVLTLINKLDYALVHARDGQEKYREAFYSIGLSWRELERLSPEKRLMAIADAIREMKNAGKGMPSDLAGVIDKRDMQTINKLVADKDFSKYIAEAGALGFQIDPKMIALAERYTDSVADAQQQILAMVSNLEATANLTERLNELWKKLGNTIGQATGMVNPTYRDKFIGIGDVTKDVMMNKADTLSDRDKREILKALWGNLKYKNQQGFETSDAFYKWLKNASSADLTKEVTRQGRLLDFNELNGALQKRLFKMAENVDSRFKVEDQSTWVQQIKAGQEAETPAQKKARMANDKALDSADELNKKIQNGIVYYDERNRKTSKFVDIEKEILAIEEKLRETTGDINSKLDDEVKHQLRLNAALLNQKTLQAEIENMKQKSSDSFKGFLADMMSQMGVDKNSYAQLLEALENTGVKTDQSTLLRELNIKLVQDRFKENGDNPEEARSKAAKALELNPEIGYSSLYEFATKNADGFFKAFADYAKEMSSKPIFRDFTEEQIKQMKEAVATFNEEAAKLKLEPIGIDFRDFTPEQLEKAKASIAKFNEELKNLHLEPIDIDFNKFNDEQLEQAKAAISKFNEQASKLNLEPISIDFENFNDAELQKANSAIAKFNEELKNLHLEPISIDFNDEQIEQAKAAISKFNEEVKNLYIEPISIEFDGTQLEKAKAAIAKFNEQASKLHLEPISIDFEDFNDEELKKAQSAIAKFNEEAAKLKLEPISIEFDGTQLEKAKAAIAKFNEQASKLKLEPISIEFNGTQLEQAKKAIAQFNEQASKLNLEPISIDFDNFNDEELEKAKAAISKFNEELKNLRLEPISIEFDKTQLDKAKASIAKFNAQASKLNFKPIEIDFENFNDEELKKAKAAIALFNAEIKKFDFSPIEIDFSDFSDKNIEKFKKEIMRFNRAAKLLKIEPIDFDLEDFLSSSDTEVQSKMYDKITAAIESLKKKYDKDSEEMDDVIFKYNVFKDKLKELKAQEEKLKNELGNESGAENITKIIRDLEAVNSEFAQLGDIEDEFTNAITKLADAKANTSSLKKELEGQATGDDATEIIAKLKEARENLLEALKNFNGEDARETIVKLEANKIQLEGYGETEISGFDEAIKQLEGSQAEIQKKLEKIGELKKKRDELVLKFTFSLDKSEENEAKAELSRIIEELNGLGSEADLRNALQATSSNLQLMKDFLSGNTVTFDELQKDLEEYKAEKEEALKKLEEATTAEEQQQAIDLVKWADIKIMISERGSIGDGLEHAMNLLEDVEKDIKPRYEEFMIKLNSLKEEKAKLEEELKKTSAEKKPTIRLRLDEINSSVIELTTGQQGQQATGDMDRAITQLTDIRKTTAEKREKLQKEIETLIEQRDAFINGLDKETDSEKRKQLEIKLPDWQMSIDVATSNLANLDRALALLDGQIEELQGAGKSLKERYTAIQTELNGLKEKRAELEKKLKEAGPANTKEIVIELEAVKLKISDLENDQEAKAVIEKYENSLEFLTKKKEDLQQKLESLPVDARVEEKRYFEDQIKELQTQIDAINKEKEELDKLMSQAAELFGSSKLVEEFQKNHKQANLQQVVQSKFKFRASNEATQGEIDVQKALNEQDKERVTLIEQQNFLRKAGIIPSKENLEIYKEELETMQKLTAELAHQKNLASLDKAIDTKMSQVDIETSKFSESQDAIAQSRKNQALMQFGIDPNEENLQKYADKIEALIQLEDELTEARNKNALKSRNENAEGQLGLEKAVYKAQDNDEIEELTKINALRQMGVDITAENIKKYEELLDKMYDVQKRTNEFNLGKSLESQAKDSRWKAMDMLGQGKEANREKALLEATQTKGSKLSMEEENLVTELADLVHAIDNFQMPEQKDDVVFTNELAQKGGFAESVAVQKQDNSQKILTAMSKLQGLLEQGNTISNRIANNLIN